MEEYNLDTVLEDNGFTASQIEYAKMLIAARLIHPSGERETARWLNENSALCELLQTDLAVYDNALHRTAVMSMIVLKSNSLKLLKTCFL
jgi:hypothetical protein